jgi:hypothetical protein
MASISDGLQAFISYCNQHIRGDEKSEAQTFLTRFFQAFGHEGIKEAGAEFEDRLRKGSSKGKTGFADLVWRSQPGLFIFLFQKFPSGQYLFLALTIGFLAIKQKRLPLMTFTFLAC